MDELRRLFDDDVERFSNEQTGQTSAVDAPLVLSIFEDTIAKMYPKAERMLDIGCGAGNFSLRIARKLPQLKLTLLDLSDKMINRAVERLTAENLTVEETIQTDVAQIELPRDKFDIAVAASSLHHLRTKDDWEKVFGQIYGSLVKGGSFWMSDLIRHENEIVESLQKERYGEYLTSTNDEVYKQRIFDNIARNDTPETLQFIQKTLGETGFNQIDILHKNTVFAALVAVKNS
jgi:tRNA (cmo5U34)-methyltransferase